MDSGRKRPVSLRTALKPTYRLLLATDLTKGLGWPSFHRNPERDRF